MTANFLKSDPIFGSLDLDDAYVDDPWLVEQFVGNALYAWGYNNAARLGLGDTTDRSSPVQVGTLTTWKQVSAESGAGTSVALKTDGTLWTWGLNTYGQLGLGDTTFRSSPVQVGALTNWKQVIACGSHCLAIKTDGTLWAWGGNDNGRLGLGDLTHRSSPVQVGALTDWKELSNFFNGAQSASSICIKTDGTLWAWGSNTNGQLGLGNLTHRSSPVQVGALTDWKQLVISSSCLAIKTDGTLWAWGSNSSGKLGLGDLTHRSSPVQVGALTNWKQVCQISDTAYAIKEGNTLWAWGSNLSGRLALGDLTSRSSPVQVGSLTNWKQVGPQKAVKTDGTLWAWGNNFYGQLGLGDRTHRSSPVQVGALTNWKLVAGGSDVSFGIYYYDIVQ